MDIASTAILSVFAYVLMIVIAGLAALLIRGIVLALAHAQAQREAAPTSVSISVGSAVDDTAGHVAAIAAAVYAHIGPHRLVHIHEVPRGPGWTAIGRLAHHTSHAPQRGSR